MELDGSGKMKNKRTGKKRKVRIDMSVELDVLMSSEKSEYEQLNEIGRIYASCFSDKDIKIEGVKFLN